ncbi:MAG: hypothetical protein ACQGVK_01425 [Myxococcota bacterium]
MRRWWIVLCVLLMPAWTAPTCRFAPRLPALVASDPAPAATAARSAWVTLDFAGPVAPASLGRIVAFCGGGFVGASVRLLDADTAVLRPASDLPAGSTCRVYLSTEAGDETLEFETRAAGPAFQAVYDRRDRDRPLPFPDDFFLVDDGSTVTGLRPQVTLPATGGTAGTLIKNLARVAEAGADGWSPIGPISVELSAAPDPASLPLDRAATLDPRSTIALVDMTPGSAHYGERVPFKVIPRSDSFPPEPVSHNLVMSPGIALEPEGQYGLVVTDRVLDGAGEPLGRSAFFEAVVGPPIPGEAAEVARARPLAEEVLSLARSLSPLPIPRDDVVLAVKLSIRSTDHFVDDGLKMRADVAAADPDVRITSVESGSGNVAAFVEGTFDVPDWLPGIYLNRGADGLPEPDGSRTIEFVLALPPAAAGEGRAPVVMYQHGSPGSAQSEVPGAAERFLAEAGFAVAGFTDTPNRVAPTTDELTFAILANVLINGEAPDYYLVTYGEQLGFLRALQALADLDVLPLGAPDGVPDIDPTQLVYEGISYGSNHSQAFLAYAPEIRAAAMVVGAVRFVELLEHQDRTLPLGGDPLIRVTLPNFLTGVRAPDFWMGMSLFALTYDRQDPHNHARFIYREPALIDGSTRRASLLVVEGIDDSFTANNSTRSLARQLGDIPQLSPPVVKVPDLPEQAGPIQGNIAPDTTAAMVQFAPAGSGLPPTPGCELQFEGHYCAQSAPSARAQRARFYRSALDGVPVID